MFLSMALTCRWRRGSIGFRVFVSMASETLRADESHLSSPD